MSDYVKKKVLRHPLLEILEDDIYDFENKIKKIDKNFAIGHGYDDTLNQSKYYLDYILEYSYGEESGDYGYVWKLNEKEVQKYKSIFETIIPNVDMEEVHKVIFCYYNGVDCPDYYELLDW